MPIYEYQCHKCGQVVEALQKFSDKPLSKCPHCGGRMDKLMSMNSFQLKGGGWYLTDYAKKDTPGKSPEAAPKAEAKEAKENKPAKKEAKAAE